MLFRRLLLSLCLLLTATHVSAADDAAFAKAFGDDWLAQYWQFNPDFAVSVGYYQAASLLSAPTAANRKAYTRWLDQQIKHLAVFDPAQLGPAARSDLAVLKSELEAERWSLTTLKSWQWNPALYNVAEPIALLLSTSWLLTLSHNQPASDWPLYVLTALTTLVVWRTRVHMLWLIGLGALLGALGWV